MMETERLNIGLDPEDDARGVDGPADASMMSDGVGGLPDLHSRQIAFFEIGFNPRRLVGHDR